MAAETGEAISLAAMLGDHPNSAFSDVPPYRTTTRLRRLYDIMSSELLAPITQLSYIDPSAIGEVNS
jgi:hypothetical protein